MRKTTTVAAAIALVLGGGAASADKTVHGPMAFEPIEGSAYDLTADWGNTPFVIPEGCRQYKVSDERDLNIYQTDTDGTDIGRDFPDLGDMNTVNETGKQAGRFLYRTHEVDEAGALSVVDLKTGQAKVIAQATDGTSPVGPTFSEFTQGRDLDGIRWTPWGTILFAEEDPQGRVYEMFLDPEDPSTALDVKDRPAVGRIRHEGIEVGTDGSVFVIDELNGGSIFKFVPEHYGDLSSGQLYALKVIGLSSADQNWDTTMSDRVGAFEWVALDRAQVQIDAKAAADAVDATEYGRPEDVERIGDTLYVALTTETRVLAIDLNQQVVSTFIAAGINAPEQDLSAIGPVGAPPVEDFVTGFDDPDNLAQGPDGRLWIVEDNSPSDIWVAEPDRDGDGYADKVHLFASLRDGAWDCDAQVNGICNDWDDNGAEGTGLYFGKDPKTLYVNIQHAEAELRDGTWAITARRDRDDEHRSRGHDHNAVNEQDDDDRDQRNRHHNR